MMDDLRAAWLSEIAILMTTTPGPTRPPAKPQPHTYQRFGATYCSLCDLQVAPVEYCKCGTGEATDEPPNDGTDTQLRQRIAEARTGR